MGDIYPFVPSAAREIVEYHARILPILEAGWADLQAATRTLGVPQPATGLRYNWPERLAVVSDVDHHGYNLLVKAGGLLDANNPASVDARASLTRMNVRVAGSEPHSAAVHDEVLGRVAAATTRYFFSVKPEGDASAWPATLNPYPSTLAQPKQTLSLEELLSDIATWGSEEIKRRQREHFGRQIVAHSRLTRLLFGVRPLER